MAGRQAGLSMIELLLEKRIAAATIALAALLAGCGQNNTYVAPPPLKVTVATPVEQKVTRYFETTGNATAINSANLVARVSGFLKEIAYKDGTPVKQGDHLFTIEPEPYQLKLQQSQAAEAGAEATLTQAQADTKQAQINLDYTRVVAPFDGIVTARQVSIGELVGGSGTQVLATIVQLHPIHVNFNASERDVLRVRDMLVKRGETALELIGTPVEIGLQTDPGYPHKGKLDYIAPMVDPGTGTLAARAVLPNEARLLLPGFFVRVRVPLEDTPAMLVPSVALGSDQAGRYVLVVDDDNIVQQRKVTVGPAVGELAVVESGLKPDDRVIVAGLLRAIPGQKVDPQTQTAAK